MDSVLGEPFPFAIKAVIKIISCGLDNIKCWFPDFDNLAVVIEKNFLIFRRYTFMSKGSCLQFK